MLLMTSSSDFCDFSRTSVRREEALVVRQTLLSPNHLILASPAHFGKAALVRAVAKSLDHPLVEIDGRLVTGLTDISAQLLKAAFRWLRPDDFRRSLLTFHRIPSITTDLMTGQVHLSFTADTDPQQLLDESLSLLPSLTSLENRLIVFWRNFPCLLDAAPHLERKLRALLETQDNVNHVFSGSPERRMSEIFERASAPFFHFGRWFPLSPIPEDEIRAILAESFRPMSSEAAAQTLAAALIQTVGTHPYYLRQAAETLRNFLPADMPPDAETVRQMIEHIVFQKLWDYERLWDTFSQSQKKALQLVVANQPFAGLPDFPATTLYSAAQKLQKAGLLFKTPAFEVEDPFLRRWIASQQVA